MEASTENTAQENTPVTEQAKDEKVVEQSQKRSKKEEKMQRKEDRTLEQFMKSLNGIQSIEDKYIAACKKYAETAKENKKLQTIVKYSEDKFTLAVREREQLQLEYNRTVLVKSKLENLCRLLQKQNKSIKEESLQKIKDEEERRKETQAKFQTTLSEITTMLQQNNEKNTELREDNFNMAKNFKLVSEQFELREQQLGKITKQIQLETQLSESKLAKASLEAQAERERHNAEKSQLQLELVQCKSKIVESMQAETALRNKIVMITDKYDDFQNALVKSNKVFLGFKEEMEKMSKKVLKLEKESMSWKKRWEGSQVALLDMASDKQNADERTALCERQLAQLQRLCRTMQSERTVLLNTLKDNNIERPPLPALPPAPAPLPPAAPSSNVEAMAANCAQLKDSLAQLQSQLTALTNKNSAPSNETAESTNKVETPNQKTKKGRARKNKASKEADKDVTVIPAEASTVTNEASINSESVVQNIDDSVKSDDIKVKLDSSDTDSGENKEIQIDLKPVAQDKDMVNTEHSNLVVNDDALEPPAGFEACQMLPTEVCIDLVKTSLNVLDQNGIDTECTKVNEVKKLLENCQEKVSRIMKTGESSSETNQSPETNINSNESSAIVDNDTSSKSDIEDSLLNNLKTNTANVNNLSSELLKLSIMNAENTYASDTKDITSIVNSLSNLINDVDHKNKSLENLQSDIEKDATVFTESDLVINDVPTVNELADELKNIQ